MWKGEKAEEGRTAKKRSYGLIINLFTVVRNDKQRAALVEH